MNIIMIPMLAVTIEVSKENFTSEDEKKDSRPLV